MSSLDSRCSPGKGGQCLGRGQFRGCLCTGSELGLPWERSLWPGPWACKPVLLAEATTGQPRPLVLSGKQPADMGAARVRFEIGAGKQFAAASCQPQGSVGSDRSSVPAGCSHEGALVSGELGLQVKWIQGLS